eukprot:3627848-Heterocapsa_arctica.AAC.1
MSYVSWVDFPQRKELPGSCAPNVLVEETICREIGCALFDAALLKVAALGVDPAEGREARRQSFCHGQTHHGQTNPFRNNFEQGQLALSA